jgi:hypothetical protein
MTCFGRRKDVGLNPAFSILLFVEWYRGLSHRKRTIRLRHGLPRLVGW